MAKTKFGTGVVVTSQWLNGSHRLFFDGQTDLDWHYNPLGLESLVLAGRNGLDTRYLTLGTDQPVVDAGILLTGAPISGNKVTTGLWSFGMAELGSNPANNPENAPKSYTTNTKYNLANSIPNPTIPQKFGALSEEDLVTKLVLTEQLLSLLDGLSVTNGYYAVVSDTPCNNYSAPGGSSTVCSPSLVI